MLILIYYLSAGVIAGITAGLLGLGGGVVIVPLLYAVFLLEGLAPGATMQLAVGTSLATIVFTAISAGYSHHKLGNVLVNTLYVLAPGIVLGAFLGAGIADALPTDILKRAFGVFELIIAMQIGFGLKPSAHRTLPAVPGQMLAGSLIGTISAVMGIGGGSLTVPYLLWCNVSMRQAVGTSAACGLPIALAGTTGFIVTGLDHPELPRWSLGYVYWPAALSIVIMSVLFAPLGARLASKLPIQTLKRLFAMVLALIGLKMIFW